MGHGPYKQKRARERARLLMCRGIVSRHESRREGMNNESRPAVHGVEARC